MSTASAPASPEETSAAAREFGALGGRSGTGKAKRRGGKDYYRKLAKKSAAARRKKRKEAEAAT